jgi:uncharacterized membrane protein (UPF0127 family)
MKVRINDNIFNVKTLVDKKSQSIGMMGKTFGATFEGLLFLMGGDKQSFWMKNCITNLDIIFIDKGNITKIHHNCKPCNSDDCENFEGNGDMVLELRGGECKKYGIEEGDSIDIQS